MRANRVSAYVFAAAASLAGCAGTGEVRYSGQVRVTEPQLVYIEPGIQVVADADEPLFYSDGYYWLYRDGYWLRSNTYQSGFVRVELSYVPERVRLIDRPQAYVQYRRHMGRDRAARNPPMPTRSRPYPEGTYRDGEPYPTNRNTPVSPDDAWRPAPTPGSRPDMTPLPANPTPPVTSPNDVRGTPMPPHQVPPNAGQPTNAPGRDRVPPGQERRPQSDAGNGSTIDSEHGNDHRPTPPGQAGRPGPQAVPPATEPARDDHGHGNAPDRDDRGNGRGNAPERNPADRGNAQSPRVEDSNDRVDTNTPRDNGRGRSDKDKSDKSDKRDRKNKQ